MLHPQVFSKYPKCHWMNILHFRNRSIFLYIFQSPFICNSFARCTSFTTNCHPWGIYPWMKFASASKTSLHIWPYYKWRFKFAASRQSLIFLFTCPIQHPLGVSNCADSFLLWGQSYLTNWKSGKFRPFRSSSIWMNLYLTVVSDTLFASFPASSERWVGFFAQFVYCGAQFFESIQYRHNTI